MRTRTAQSIRGPTSEHHLNRRDPWQLLNRGFQGNAVLKIRSKSSIPLITSHENAKYCLRLRALQRAREHARLGLGLASFIILRAFHSLFTHARYAPRPSPHAQRPHHLSGTTTHAVSECIVYNIKKRAVYACRASLSQRSPSSNLQIQRCCVYLCLHCTLQTA